MSFNSTENIFLRNQKYVWLPEQSIDHEATKKLFRQVNYFIADMYRIHKWIATEH